MILCSANRPRLFLFSLFGVLCWGLPSCVNTKRAIYFRDQGDGTIRSSFLVPETIIEANDILSIQVSSLNPEASAAFNAASTSNNASATPSPGSLSEAAGYLVSRQGFITFPILGNIRAAGLTKDQLTDSISHILSDKKLLVDPIVSIRMLNFKVTVLGEVEHPSVFSVPAEKISLLEALGLAGDLTINAKRDNVLIIREETGKKVIKRIDLNSSELFTSPYYYLQSNDVVYAEPNKAKVRSSSNTAMWVSVIFAALSFGVIAIENIK